jgi:hypothetical protein
MIEIKRWAAIESDLQKLPGGITLCKRVRKGEEPWPVIRDAIMDCTIFPSAEFYGLREKGDFDVRWPLTFAAWYWGVSGGSVDKACTDFLSANKLWDEAIKVFPEYGDPEWLCEWVNHLKQKYSG